MRKPEFTLAVLKLCALTASEPDGLPLAAAELIEGLGLDEAETDALTDALIHLAKENFIEANADSGGPGGLRFTITKVTEDGLRRANASN